jgi:hypothetical protein
MIGLPSLHRSQNGAAMVNDSLPSILLSIRDMRPLYLSARHPLVFTLVHLH